MPERPRFQQVQYDFAAHIRDPEHNPAPEGIEDRRMAVYRELFFNNVASLLAGTFPVLHKLLPDEQWQALMRDYFSVHKAETPLFLEMPQEFIRYLQDERGERKGDPPFLTELAHYEWAELAVSVLDEEPDLAVVDAGGDLLAGVPVVSPTAWSLAYTFPVHRIRPDFQPDTPGDALTYLVVYRDLQDKVGFLEINAVTARLLELLERGDDRSGRDTLAAIAAEIGHPNPDGVIAAGADILERLRRHDIVLGTRRPASQSPTAAGDRPGNDHQE